MTKLGQLHLLTELDLHTAPYAGVSWSDWQNGAYKAHARKLRFPVAVRSTFRGEDSAEQSMAGHFHTALWVAEDELAEAIEAVFASYPQVEGESVIVQEMVESEVSGVLFAHRNGVWKTEMVRGAGEALVSGKSQPMTLLLPKFKRIDYTSSWWRQAWKPFGPDREKRSWVRPLMYLALATEKLMEATADSAPYGLDIEYAISRGRCYVLQARPITTPDELEEVLTSANHKEILPPQPSRFMTGLIASCSKHLFGYYRKLDPSLPERNFIEVSEGMPWINLTALLDTMIAWGLPTSLVCESVGAEDVYRVGVRPYQGFKNWRIFVKILKEQLAVAGRTRRWVRATQRRLLQEAEARRLMWRNTPALAYQNWLTSAQLVYVDLVSLMQALTGAMSGPTKLFAKLGWLQQLSDQSESSRYLAAFRQWRRGEVSLDRFLKEYGHRGFYESDLGQKRFAEFGAEDWDRLGADLPPQRVVTHRRRPWINRLTRPVVRLLHTREWLRHHTMRYFFMLRSELLEQSQYRFGADFDPFMASPEELH
ncbi:MAG: PEP/pyruvate-binding domain-containing protein, partial [Bacteroidota bacterium]